MNVTSVLGVLVRASVCSPRCLPLAKCVQLAYNECRKFNNTLNEVKGINMHAGRAPFTYVSQRKRNFEMFLAKAKGVFQKRGESKAEALACVGVFQQAKPKTVNYQVN
eukprot:6186450-Pleurochrysis_carterae.AAC.5